MNRGGSENLLCKMESSKRFECLRNRGAPDLQLKLRGLHAVVGDIEVLARFAAGRSADREL
jgi:hypothetical protein